MFGTVAKFEKVSYEQFYKDFINTFNMKEIKKNEDGSIETIPLDSLVRKTYDSIKSPKRATKGSAGYDFFTPIDLNIVPLTTVKVPTGIRCKMKHRYVLQIYPRSSLGFKYRLQLDNTTGIIDSDYHSSDNEGHIFIKITNDTHENKTVELKQGEAFAQGIFSRYYLAKEDKVKTERNGGFGSTNENTTKTD